MPRRLRGAMQSVLDDPRARRRRDAASGSTISAQRFSLAHMADQIEALYRRLLATQLRRASFTEFNTPLARQCRRRVLYR